jgi:hypothetical protein
LNENESFENDFVNNFLNKNENIRKKIGDDNIKHEIKLFCLLKLNKQEILQKITNLNKKEKELERDFRVVLALFYLENGTWENEYNNNGNNKKMHLNTNCIKVLWKLFLQCRKENIKIEKIDKNKIKPNAIILGNMFQLVVDNIDKLSKALKRKELKEKKEKDGEQNKSYNSAHNWFDGFLLQTLFQEEMKSIFKDDDGF